MNKIVFKPLCYKTEPIFRKHFTYILLHGGRSSGKSWEIASYLVIAAYRYKIKVACLRQVQLRISESSFAVVKKMIKRLGLSDYFETYKTVIRCKKTGSEFHFAGMQDPESLKSWEGVTHAWIEEGQQIFQESWDILVPTILRNAGAQIICSANLRSPHDTLAKVFLGDDPPFNSYVAHMTYSDNPHLSAEIIKDIEDMKKNDFQRYMRIYGGEFTTSIDNFIFSHERLQKTINRIPVADRHAHARAGLDVAREGSDKTAIAIMIAHEVVHLEEWREPDTTKTTARVVSLCQQYNVTAIAVDAVGIGGPVADMIRKSGQVKFVFEFKNNAEPNPQRPVGCKTANLISQATYRLYEDIDKICMRPARGAAAVQKLLQQLSVLRYDYDKDDRWYTVSKKVLKRKYGLQESPDLAEALIMCNNLPALVPASARSRQIGEIIVEY